MVSVAEARKLVLALDGALDEPGAERLAFSIAGKGFAWTFMSRPAPKAKRAPDIGVLAVSCTLEASRC